MNENQIQNNPLALLIFTIVGLVICFFAWQNYERTMQSIRDRGNLSSENYDVNKGSPKEARRELTENEKNQGAARAILKTYGNPNMSEEERNRAAKRAADEWDKVK